MEQEHLANAIKKLRPEAEFSFQSADYSTINWITLDGDAPTKAEILEAVKQVKAEAAAAAKAELARKQEILNRLGITESEARLILS